MVFQDVSPAIMVEWQEKRDVNWKRWKLYFGTKSKWVQLSFAPFSSACLEVVPEVYSGKLFSAGKTGIFEPHFGYFRVSVRATPYFLRNMYAVVLGWTKTTTKWAIDQEGRHRNGNRWYNLSSRAIKTSPTFARTGALISIAWTIGEPSSDLLALLRLQDLSPFDPKEMPRTRLWYAALAGLKWPCPLIIHRLAWYNWSRGCHAELFQ